VITIGTHTRRTVAALGLVATLGGIGTQPALAVATRTVPAFDHIYVVVMENHELGSIVGNRHAPFINGLVHDFGLATHYTAVAHPSEPNYMALFAGGTMGIHGDGVFHLDGRSIADQIETHGRSWHVYAQDYPGDCSQAVLHAGHGVDFVGARGTYARRHEPAISFNAIANDPTRCAHITSLASFDPAAADFELVVPNLINDMHDGSIARGDAFLNAFVPHITSSADFANSLLVITWDEGSTSLGGGGRVATIIVSAHGKAGFRSVVHHDHYSLVHTIQDAWGLGCLRHTCAANDLREFFAP
jgi:hypothetical protein